MNGLLTELFDSLGGPILLFFGFFIIYKVFQVSGVNIEQEFVNLKFKVYNGRTTLRIHLPQEVFKSPAAMENVLHQIYNVNSSDNLMQAFLDGKHPLTYSFELVSIGGEVRFYINVPKKKIKDMVEAHLYAEYPGIEVVEEDIDYTSEIPWDPEKYDYISFHMNKRKDEEFPIKTYVDYGLDKTPLPKEEEKSDPMAIMLEQLGKVKPHERVWIQILARPHTARSIKTGYLTAKPTWDSKVQAKVDEIMKRDTRIDASSDEPTERMTALTTNERDKIAAMERNVGKYAYEVGIRWMYITPSGKFNGNAISPFLRSFAPYDLLNRNGVGIKWRTDYDYNFFSDPTGKKVLRWKKSELFMYKIRKYYMRERGKRTDERKVFSSEELATMFHIPGSTVVTPTLSRITSTKKGPPSNLPTGVFKGI